MARRSTIPTDAARATLRRRPIIVALLSLLTLLVLSACSGASDTSTEGGGDTGGVTTSANATTGSETISDPLVLNTVDVYRSGDPARAYEWASLYHNLYDTLLTFEGNDVSKPVPSLAESYTVSDDATTFTFTLRQDVKFSDGTPMTSADVVFSLSRAKNLNARPSWMLEGLSFTAPDDHTVVITSENPYPDLPFVLPFFSFGIVNSKVVKENGGTDAADAETADRSEGWFGTHSAGTGPYMLESFSQSSGAVLVANPNYWGEPKPQFARAVIRYVEGPGQVLAVQRDRDVITPDVPSLQAEQLRGNSAVTVQENLSPNWFYLALNVNPSVSEVTSNQRFRNAVRYAIDYKGLLDVVGPGSIQSPGIIPVQFVGALPESEVVQRDVEKAKAELAASGLANPSITLEYATDTQPNGVDLGVVAQKIKANLEEVGIGVELRGATLVTLVERQRAGTEEASLWWWIPDYPAPGDYQTFLPGQPFGERFGMTAGFNPEIEELATQASQTSDEQERGTLYQEIQRKLNEVGPYIPLFQPIQVLAHSSTLSNVVYAPTSWIDLNSVVRTE